MFFFGRPKSKLKSSYKLHLLFKGSNNDAILFPTQAIKGYFILLKFHCNQTSDFFLYFYLKQWSVHCSSHLSSFLGVVINVGEAALATILTIKVRSHEDTSTTLLVGALTPQTGDLAIVVDLNMQTIVVVLHKIMISMRTLLSQVLSYGNAVVVFIVYRKVS